MTDAQGSNPRCTRLLDMPTPTRCGKPAAYESWGTMDGKMSYRCVECFREWKESRGLSLALRTWGPIAGKSLPRKEGAEL